MKGEGLAERIEQMVFCERETGRKRERERKRIVFLHSTFSRGLRLIGGNTTKVGEKNYDMKTLLRTVLTLALLIPLQVASYAWNVQTGFRNEMSSGAKLLCKQIHKCIG